MALPAISPKDTCSKCGAVLSAAMRHCFTCKTDIGAPNVRRCNTKDNLKTLTDRFDASQARAGVDGCSKEFSDLEVILKGKSGVVVSMSAGVARKLFEDPNALYANYEGLVGGGIRKPAESENDRHRYAVGGMLFGSYADSIIYGVLSLTEDGLPTYGAVHCRLRSVAIDKRTSFLETNSYKFVEDHQIVAGNSLPDGYMASWEHRHTLALAKLVGRLSAGQTETDWQAMLISSDGQNRQNDDFIEAHIFENFDGNAIESLAEAIGKKLSRSERLDIDLAIDLFRRLGKIIK